MKITTTVVLLVGLLLLSVTEGRKRRKSRGRGRTNVLVSSKSLSAEECHHKCTTRDCVFLATQKNCFLFLKGGKAPAGFEKCKFCKYGCGMGKKPANMGKITSHVLSGDAKTWEQCHKTCQKKSLCVKAFMNTNTKKCYLLNNADTHGMPSMSPKGFQPCNMCLVGKMILKGGRGGQMPLDPGENSAPGPISGNRKAPKPKMPKDPSETMG